MSDCESGKCEVGVNQNRVGRGYCYECMGCGAVYPLDPVFYPDPDTLECNAWCPKADCGARLIVAPKKKETTPK